MDLSRIERQRAGLMQFLIVLIMIFLLLIMVLAWRGEHGFLIKGMSLIALLACLNVMVKERALMRTQRQLIDEILRKRHQVNALGLELEAEKEESTKLEHRLQELTSLYRAISSVNAVHHHYQTYDTVLGAALELVGGNCGSLMLVDRSRRHLNYASAVGCGGDVLSQTNLRVGEGLAGWVAENLEWIMISGDFEDDERFTKSVFREPKMDQTIAVPLELGEKTIGVLCLGAVGDGAKVPFTDNDLRFAYIFAQHAAVAIERALLQDEHEQLRQVVTAVEPQQPRDDAAPAPAGIPGNGRGGVAGDEDDL